MVLHHAFVKSAKKNGKKWAIIDRTLNLKVTYSRALIGALALAKKIKKFREGYIGIMIPTSAGAFLATLGVLMAGKIPAMINYSTGAAENCLYAQGKCGFKTIITSRALVEKIGCRIVPGMVFIEDMRDSISAREKISAAVKAKLPTRMLLGSLPAANMDDNLVILFTSGSEKEPRAVQLTHRNFASNIKDLVKAGKLTGDDIILCILPLFHVFGHNGNLWLPLTVGMTAVTFANPLDYKKIPVIARQERVTIMASTPIFLAGYLRESQAGDFSSVRLMIAGADKTPHWLRRGFREKHRIELLEGYGCTETSPVISVNTPQVNRPGSVGKPVPSARVKITDIDTGEELGPGQEGKILVKGDLVMKGYFDDIEETSLRIRNSWYDTGDIGLLDEDGFLWHKGRLRRFVKIGGEMVSLVRTEGVLEEILPEGIGCCVVEVPDARKGARIIAVVTEKIDEKGIMKKLSEKLPPIALPKEFVVLPELPRMASGKIDFRTVTARVRERV